MCLKYDWSEKMEFKTVINKRRTIREFSNELVPNEIIMESLDAGLKAPSYNHLKQWDFIMVRDPKIRLALTQTEEMIDKVSTNLIHAFKTMRVWQKKCIWMPFQNRSR